MGSGGLHDLPEGSQLLRSTAGTWNLIFRLQVHIQCRFHSAYLIGNASAHLYTYKIGDLAQKLIITTTCIQNMLHCAFTFSSNSEVTESEIQLPIRMFLMTSMTGFKLALEKPPCCCFNLYHLLNQPRSLMVKVQSPGIGHHSKELTWE